MDIHFDWTDFRATVQQAVDPFQTPHALEPVGRAMETVGIDLANTWEGVAYGLTLPGMTRAVHDPVYAASIGYRQQGLLAVDVTSSDPVRDARAQAYAAPWDMKPRLLGGPKARKTVARPGRPSHRFNIIPMRHPAEQVSTEALWALVQTLRRFDPQDVPRLAKFTPVGVYVHRAALEAGIRLGSSGPVTFRTVSEGSAPASWWYPARAANPIADSVWTLFEATVTADLRAAWEAALLGGPP